MKQLRDWKYEQVELTFGLERRFGHALLDSWLAAQHPIPDSHRTMLEELRQELIRHIDAYNEEELKFYFLGPLVRLIRFHAKDRRPFLDRNMTFTYGGGQRTGGRIDWMLAQGKQDPRQPFFFSA